ncbi:MAG TPA: ATP-binding protein [Thermoanaerobaculia bacterium]|jgi:signal transduction histidine kinase|nr:ATP-binding protein [Thermoanaerobaculia bacterium]
MTLRAKIVLYIAALHLVLGAAAVFVLIEQRALLFAVEALFVLSILISWRLVRALFVPLELIRTGAELISERDFTTRFTAVGQPEMDALIRVYNAMIDQLREERLAAEEQSQLLGKIVEASPSGVVICDFDGAVAQMNPAAARLMPIELASVPTGESRLLAHHGNRRLKVSRAEFRDRGFAKSFYILEELTEELRLSEKAAYEKLIRMMSHEVNNSVGAVRSLLESSLRYAADVRAEDREDFTNALSIASSRIDALNRFMASFADVVRIPPPRRTPTPLRPLVTSLASLLRPELDARSITLQLDLAEVTADIDAHQFEQVLLNVLRNAAESIGREGVIAITLRPDGLVIADSGQGIAQDAQADLFTPFFTTKRDGRGLGLTIVQEILTNHALPFSLENRAGGGAEFRVGFHA